MENQPFFDTLAFLVDFICRVVIFIAEFLSEAQDIVDLLVVGIHLVEEVLVFLDRFVASFQ